MGKDIAMLHNYPDLAVVWMDYLCWWAWRLRWEGEGGVALAFA